MGGREAERWVRMLNRAPDRRHLRPGPRLWAERRERIPQDSVLQRGTWRVLERESRVPQLPTRVQVSGVHLAEAGNLTGEVGRQWRRGGEPGLGHVKFRYLGTPKRRGDPGPDMELSGEEGPETEPHAARMAASSQEAQGSCFSLWLLCGLRVEKFISWVALWVLFLESPRREKADGGSRPEHRSVNPSALIRTLTRDAGSCGEDRQRMQGSPDPRATTG